MVNPKHNNEVASSCILSYLVDVIGGVDKNIIWSRDRGLDAQAETNKEREDRRQQDAQARAAKLGVASYDTWELHFSTELRLVWYSAPSPVQCV